MASKGRKVLVVKASLSHAATEVRGLSKELEAAVNDRRAPVEAAKIMQEVVNGAKSADPMTPGAFVLEISRPTGTRSLAAVLGEGPVPGKLVLPPGAPVPEAIQREGFTRPADPRTSLEPFPGELNALRATKQITMQSEDAAKRLGFDVNSTGSALDALYQFLYRTFLGQRSQRPEDAKAYEGQHSNLFSPIAEFALNRHPTLMAGEDAAVREALASMTKTDSALRVFDYSAMEKSLPLPVGPTLTGARASEGLAVLRKYRVAEGVLDVELYNVRDTKGETGLQVTDRLRGLLDLRKTPPEFTIISIGEAKAKWGYREIMGQIVNDVERLLQGFRAPQGGSGAVQSFERVRVKFGPRLIVASLSERRPPGSHVQTLTSRIQSIFRSSKQTPPEVIPLEIDPTSIYADARTIATELQAAFNELARKPVP
jgi:hypothetical protein